MRLKHTLAVAIIAFALDAVLSGRVDASRTERALSTQLAVDKKAAPFPGSHALLEASEQFVMRECSLKLLSNYELTIKPERRMIAVHMAKEAILQEEGLGTGVYNVLRTLLGRSNREHPLLSVTMGSEDGLDVDLYPQCPEGSNAIACAETLPPHVWLQEWWELEDILQANQRQWYCPWCKVRVDRDRDALEAKKDLFGLSLKYLGFSISRAKKYCQKSSLLPDVSVMRSCVEESAESRGIGAGPQNLVPTLQALWKAEDTLTAFEVSRPDFYGHSHMLDLGKGASREKITETIKQLTDAVKRLSSSAFDLDTARKACQTSLTPALKVSLMTRTVSELTTACEISKMGHRRKCIEKEGTYCPEGHAPDSRRKGIGRATGALLLGPPVGMLGSYAMGCGIGLTGLGPPGCAAGLKMASSDPLLASAYFIAFAKSWAPECMCYEHKCTFDKDSQRCTMEPLASSQGSANPFTLLPTSGLACVLSEKSNMTRGNKCEVRACNREDVASAGPYLPDGARLWGRVGRSKDHLATKEGLYNCPSTGATLDTQFAAFNELPLSRPLGLFVENTPAARSALLGFYEPEF